MSQHNHSNAHSQAEAISTTHSFLTRTMNDGRIPSRLRHALLLTGLFVFAGVLSKDASATPPQLVVQHAASTGSMPKGVTISRDGSRLYVSNYGQLDRNNISVYDARTMQLLHRIDVPGIVVESAVSPDGRTLYVSNFRRNSVQFIDLSSRTVRHEVHAGSHPKVLVLSHDGRRLFAANWGGRNVTEIDTQSAAVVRTLAAGANPRGMAITRSGRLYIANFNDRSMDVYEGASMQSHRRIENVCRIPRHLVLSPDDSKLYITCFGNSQLFVMDTRSDQILQRVNVGRSPKSNDVTPDGRYVVTADYGGSSISVVDTRDWSVRTLDVPGMDSASGVVAARRGYRFYVTGWYDDHLYAVGSTDEPVTYHPTRSMIRAALAAREFHRTHPVE